jgi:hypothetical protein
MVARPTARRPLMARLSRTLAMGLLALAALGPSGTGATVRAGDGVTDDGTLLIGVPAFDYIDPALTPTPNSSRSQGAFTVSWGVADATCALLLRYPVRTPPGVRFDLVPEVAERYPALLPTAGRGRS